MNQLKLENSQHHTIMHPCEVRSAGATITFTPESSKFTVPGIELLEIIESI